MAEQAVQKRVNDAVDKLLHGGNIQEAEDVLDATDTAALDDLLGGEADAAAEIPEEGAESDLDEVCEEALMAAENALSKAVELKDVDEATLEELNDALIKVRAVLYPEGEENEEAEEELEVPEEPEVAEEPEEEPAKE